MAKIKFTSGATVITFSCARIYPIHDPLKVGVVIGYSDGKQLYAYDKAVDEQFYYLTFEALATADDTALRSFHGTTVRGPLTVFTYTDEDGDDHAVRWLDIEYPLKQNKNNRHFGTIKLRKEI